jgi:hypothetical protein
VKLFSLWMSLALLVATLIALGYRGWRGLALADDFKGRKQLALHHQLIGSLARATEQMALQHGELERALFEQCLELRDATVFGIKAGEIGLHAASMVPRALISYLIIGLFAGNACVLLMISASTSRFASAMPLV